MNLCCSNCGQNKAMYCATCNHSKVEEIADLKKGIKEIQSYANNIQHNNSKNMNHVKLLCDRLLKEKQ